MKVLFLILFSILIFQFAPIIFAAIPPMPPKGYLDFANCTQAAGWACIENLPNTQLQIKFYADAPKGIGGYIGQTTANLQRENAVGNQCGGNSFHGYSFLIPNTVKTNNARNIYAYAVQTGNLFEEQLIGSPKLINCLAPIATPTTRPTVIPTPIPPLGDINKDCRVDARDYDIFARNLGAKIPLPDSRPDLNNDGKINVLDYRILFENFGRKCLSNL